MMGIGQLKQLKRPPKNERARQLSYGFLMTVGVLLVWSIVVGIIDTTEFQASHVENLVRVFGIVGVLGFIFSRRRFIWLGALLFVGFLIFAIFGFFNFSEEPNLANQFVDLLIRTARYVGGDRRHSFEYERVVIWTISILFSLVIVFLSYYRFRFWALFTVSAVTFGILITSPAFSFSFAFYVFIFCTLALLIRYLHLRSIDKSVEAIPMTKYILPMAVTCLLVAEIFPVPQAGFARGNPFSQTFTLVNDMFYNFTRQSEFSLRQIGFGGGGGRLGGDMALNHNVFMRIRTDGSLPLYLTGAVMDTYTGYSWVNRYSEYFSVDFSVVAQNLELYERLASTEMIWLAEPLERVYSWADHDSDFFLVELNEAIEDLELVDYHEYTEAILLARRLVELTAMVDGQALVAHARSDNPGLAISHRGTVQGRLWNLDINHSPNTLEINILNFHSSSAFHAGIVQDIFARNPNVLFLRDRDGRLFPERRMPRNTRYTVLYDETDDLLANASDILQHSYRGVLRDISQAIDTILEPQADELTTVRSTLGFQHNGIFIPYEELLRNYLIPRADLIYEMYTALPLDFPTRVRDLAVAVTAGASNNYERMVMLEQYLSRNYTYTLTPGTPPRDQDFVEHFLFDIREGYCTYFATAFVTMARSLGMPARYVEGFLVSGTPDEHGFINVLNSMGHAWAEVYFEGFGWHRFEPTPRSGLSQLPGGANSTLSEGGHQIEEDWDWLLSNQGMSGEGSLPQDEGIDTSLPSSINGSEQGLEAIAQLVWIGVIIGISLVIMLIFAKIMTIYAQKRRAKKAENAVAVIHSFGVLLSYLNILKFEMAASETVLQFTDRVCTRYYGNTSEGQFLRESAAIFVRARYGNQKISMEERKVVEDAVTNLDIQLKAYIGKRRYFFNRYILTLIRGEYS